MKKLIIVLLLCLVTLGAAGCGEKTGTGNDETSINETSEKDLNENNYISNKMTRYRIYENVSDGISERGQRINEVFEETPIKNYVTKDHPSIKEIKEVAYEYIKVKYNRNYKTVTEKDLHPFFSEGIKKSDNTKVADENFIYNITTKKVSYKLLDVEDVIVKVSPSGYAFVCVDVNFNYTSDLINSSSNVKLRNSTYFIKENGEWKIDFDQAFDPEK